MKKLALAAILTLLISANCFSGPHLRLKNGDFDPVERDKTSVQSQDRSESDSKGFNYRIIQFQGPIQDDWKTEVTKSGAELLDYMPDFAFVARLNTKSEAQIKKLSYVRWIGDFTPKYRMSPNLAKLGDSDVIIRMYPNADSSAIGQRIINAKGKWHKGRNGDRRSMRASLPASELSKLAQAPGVAWIEPWAERKLQNKAARGIINATPVWNDSGLYGAGQIVAIADTGLDTGNTSTLSLDFRSRLLKAYPLGRPDTNGWSDTHGHGTHVAGSILGGGVVSGSSPTTHNYTNSFAGMAPESSLVFQSVLDDYGSLTGIPYDLNELFDPVYQDGARIHSDSWGVPNNGEYTDDSYNTDLFVWNHKDFVICFAAGNYGIDSSPADGFIDYNSLTSPATAKNCIAVGATESNITTGITGGYSVYGFSRDPIKNDKISNNPSGMAAFSSRGPTKDGRIKPDICAPGTNIISVRSHGPGAYSWAAVYDSNYVYDCGTSMSTPIVAGACALVREYYDKQGIANPSAALVKATLLNGATDIAPGQYSSPVEIPTARPNSIQGWGRLNISNALTPPSPTVVYSIDTPTGLTTGHQDTYRFYMQQNGPLHLTLVWTDYPGAVNATVELVNDLDLVITSPSGQTYRGNGKVDRLNNVETVDIPSAIAGTYTVTVSAYNIPEGPQPYALVASGPMTLSEPMTVTNVGSPKKLPDGTLLKLTGKSVTAGSDQFKNRFYIEESNRSSGIRVQYGPGGGPTVHAGAVVNVTGMLTTINGEKTITDPIVTIVSP